MIFLHLSVLSYCSRCSRLKADAVRYDGARVSITVASHTRLLPAFHGIRVIPSGLFPSDRRSPCDSLIVGNPTFDKALYIRSFTTPWRATRPKPSWHDNPCTPLAVTGTRKRTYVVCGSHI